MELSDPEPESQDNTLLIKVGHATVEIKPSFNSSLLSDVVRTLASLC
jgi:hypothetical protein